MLPLQSFFIVLNFVSIVVVQGTNGRMLDKGSAKDEAEDEMGAGGECKDALNGEEQALADDHSHM